MPKTSSDASEIQHVLVEKSIFHQAEKSTGVPWQAMAAIWYRESFSTAPPKTPGGQFQFDPPDPAISLLKALLVRYTTDLSADEIQVIANQGVNNFSSACILAACHLRQVAKFDLSPPENFFDVFCTIKLATFWAWSIELTRSIGLMRSECKSSGLK